MYLPLEQAIAVYGHIHQPFVRGVAGFTEAPLFFWGHNF
jgi:hypothetical protein